MWAFAAIAIMIVCLYLVVAFCNKIGSPHKKQNTRIVGEVEGNSDAEEWSRMRPRRKAYKKMAKEYNSRSCGDMQQTLNVMKALDDPNTHIIGVCGSKSVIHALLQSVCRRVDRDEVFDRVLRETVTKKPDVKKIQEQLAGQLRLNFNNRSESQRANELLNTIRNVPKILIILCDLDKWIDLGKVGIPFGAIHGGCKIMLTSESEEVLSKYMPRQEIFTV